MSGKRTPKLPTILEMFKADPALKGKQGHLLIQNQIFSTSDRINAFSSINLCPEPMLSIASEVYQFLLELIEEDPTCVFISDNRVMYTVKVKYYPELMRDGLELQQYDEIILDFISEYALPKNEKSKNGTVKRTKGRTSKSRKNSAA